MRLRLLNEADHSGELGVGAHRGRLHDQPAVKHCGAADDLPPRTHPGRFGLAGHRAHVDRSGPVDGEAVGGNYLPWTHHEALLFFEFVGRDDHLRPIR
ncbi:Uncharacterised protein [Mycobacterium tuberculosis]|uniref:Uncharacterized protein n=1 Tax=Mycobacterium tuberculosis TaxID=1773 RepID=A0A655AJZ0_MYCTX|nr:Uncharacterised protein [Mycobacterium tuberculosis]COW86672.1 Uncharacterised protein [Mycobacterium tuberculosis]